MSGRRSEALEQRGLSYEHFRLLIYAGWAASIMLVAALASLIP